MNELYHYGIKGMRWGVITQEPYEYKPHDKKIDIVRKQTQARSASSGSASTRTAVSSGQAKVQTRAKVANGSSAGRSFVSTNQKAMQTPISQLKKSRLLTMEDSRQTKQARQIEAQQQRTDDERARYEAERERAQYEAEQEAAIQQMIKVRQAAGMPMSDEEIERMRANGVSVSFNGGNYGNTTYDYRRPRRRG